VSDHDIELVELFEGGDPETTSVEEAMTDRVYAVPEDTPLDDVAEVMAQRKCGSVVATSRHGIEGIFTAVDACEALVDVLRRVT
jgi:acetoin utilization protein AcuB